MVLMLSGAWLQLSMLQEQLNGAQAREVAMERAKGALDEELLFARQEFEDHVRHSPLHSLTTHRVFAFMSCLEFASCPVCTSVLVSS